MTKTVNELTKAFAVYFSEMERCEQAGASWALLHLVLVLPDICASLEAGPTSPVGNRYVAWCSQHFPNNPKLLPADRYQIRNAVLHSGSTLTFSQSRASDKQTQYASISFVDPGCASMDVHQDVSPDGTNLTIDVAKLADETRTALHHWFADLQTDATRMAVVDLNLHRLARLQTKHVEFGLLAENGDQLVTEDGHRIVDTTSFPTRSST